MPYRLFGFADVQEKVRISQVHKGNESQFCAGMLVGRKMRPIADISYLVVCYLCKGTDAEEKLKKYSMDNEIQYSFFAY